MLYDSYHKKISNVVNVLRKIFKHIVLISVITVLVIASIITILATKGIVLDDDSVADNFEMVYGESLPLHTKALFAKVVYEYSTDGVEWTTDFPKALGNYMVRATAKTAFGEQKYGKVYNFAFLAKEINVFVSANSMMYGDIPAVSAELVLKDTITCEKFNFGDRLAAYTTITPNVEFVKITNGDGEDVTALYKINANTSNISVLPKPINVTISDREMIYNDTKLMYDGYEISEATPLAKGDVLQAVFDEDAYVIDVDEKQYIPELTVVSEDGLDVSVHYDIHSEVGFLKVDYRPLIIETGSIEKVYDDKELINTDYNIVGEYDIVDGHVVECVSNTSIKDVDTVENVLVLEIKNANGEDKTSNYSLFYERGTLSIIPRPVHISSESGTWVYDGEYHSADISMVGFCEGHNIKASWPDIIDVGEIENLVEIKSVTASDGREVSYNYDFIFESIGTLAVTKRPITITHENSSLDIVYDGTEKTFEHYTITSGSIAKNDTFNITFPTFSQAGTYENQNKLISATVVSNRAYENVTFDASENYEITEQFGTVIINKCPIEIQALENVKEYDGTPISSTGYEIISGTMPDGHILNIAYLSSEVDVGEYNAEIDLQNTTVSYNDSDVTSNFDITASSGNRLVITPRKITLQAESLQKPYDGTDLTSSDYSIVEGELASGQTIVNVDFIVSKTDSAENENLISRYINAIDKQSIVINDANNVNVTKNYDITCIDGVFEISLRKLAISTNSEVKVYDRLPLEGKTITLDSVSEFNDGLLEGHRIAENYKLSGSIVNVGTVNNKVAEIDILDENNQSVKEYYNISVTEGILEIIPIEINVITNSAEKVYDGTPLTCPEYTSDHIDKLLEGDTAKLTVVGTITNAGTVDNNVVFTIFYNGKDMTGDENYSINYKINYEYGSLTVTPRPIRIKPLPTATSKQYDGTPLECINYEDCSDYSDANKKEGLLPNHLLKELHFKSLTDAGEIDIEVDTDRPIVILDGDVDVANNYTFIIDTDIKLRVDKRPIVIESASATKEYDGRPLTAPNCTLTNGTLLDGHQLVLSASGTQTEEGKSSNVITEDAIILDANGNDVAKNYDITYREGTLEVYKTVVAKIVSSKGGYVYLKAKSYGDYDGKFFGPAPVANRSFTYNEKQQCSYSLWTSATLDSNDYSYNHLSVSESIKYLLPYYTVISKYNAVMPAYNSEDYTAVSTLSNYSVDYFDYSFEKEGTENLVSYYPTTYYTYTRWVKNNYLAVDSDTKAALLNLVSGVGFENMDVETRIKSIAAYLRTSANYNADYPIGLDSEADIAVAFLRDYHEGSAKHYAITATMLYRSFDIPARFVEGYIVNTVENEQVDVKDVHYWVEVFVENYGWMQVEVTTGFGGMEDHKIDITVKPKDESKIYDGDPLEASEAELFEPTEELLALFAENGYKIVAEFEGIQIAVGTSESSIKANTVRILDDKGNDVTFKFNIIEEKGNLTVTPIPIDIFLYHNAKKYDGKPLEYTDSNFYYIVDEAFRATGYTLNLKITFIDSNVHVLTAKEITDNCDLYVQFSVMDGENDLSANYCMNFVHYSLDPNAERLAPEDYIVAQITPKSIEITSATVLKEYTEGSRLTNGTVTVTRGPLVEGHRLLAVANGILEAPGVVENTINPEAVHILDAEGNEVTDNYKIDIINGTLTFTEPEE